MCKCNPARQGIKKSGNKKPGVAGLFEGEPYAIARAAEVVLPRGFEPLYLP